MSKEEVALGKSYADNIRNIDKNFDDVYSIKLDKAEGKSDYTRVYVCFADGTNGLVNLSTVAQPSSAVWRDENGHISVVNPESADDAVNKRYVDNLIEQLRKEIQSGSSSGNTGTGSLGSARPSQP